MVPVLLVIALLAVPTAHGEDAPPSASSEARTAFERGRDAYDSGRFAEALEHFERSYSLSGHPKLLFNIARAADGDGQVERAISAYESYLERENDAGNREFVRGRLQRLRASASPSQASPSPARDSTTQLPPVTFAANDGASPSAAQLETRTLGPEAPRHDNAPAWKRPWLWIGIGVAVVGGLTAGLVLGLRGDDAPKRTDANAYISTLRVE